MSETAPTAYDPPPTPFSLRVRLAVMMGLQYFVQGCYLPIISVYVQDALGFTAGQVGNLNAAIAVGPLVAPFVVGQLVDRYVPTQKVLAFCHLCGGILMLLLFFQTNLWVVIGLGTLYSVLYVPSMMLTNSLAFAHISDREREFPLIRLWGTIGFILPAWLIESVFLSGLEGEALNTGRGVALLLAGIAGLIMAAYSLTLPNTPPPKSESYEVAPVRAAKMLRYSDVLVFVLVTFLIAIAHNFFFTWNGPYLTTVLRSGGIEGAWEQRISSLGQISEILVMVFVGMGLRKFGFRRVLLLGAGAYVLRCLLLAGAISGGFPFSTMLTIVCLGQILHGFCFGCFLAVGFIYMDEVSPPDIRGSIQNLYGVFVLGAGFFLGALVGGQIGEVFTQTADETPLRRVLGIVSNAGITTFEQTVNNVPIMLSRDWPMIWLSSAAIAAAGWLLLFVAFRGRTELVDPPPVKVADP